MFILQNFSDRFFIYNFNNDLSFSSRIWSYFKSSHPMQQTFCSDTKFTSNTPWNCIQEKINAFTIWIRKQNCISTYRNIFNYNLFLFSVSYFSPHKTQRLHTNVVSVWFKHSPQTDREFSFFNFFSNIERINLKFISCGHEIK